MYAFIFLFIYFLNMRIRIYPLLFERGLTVFVEASETRTGAYIPLILCAGFVRRVNSCILCNKPCMALLVVEGIKVRKMLSVAQHHTFSEWFKPRGARS